MTQLSVTNQSVVSFNFACQFFLLTHNYFYLTLLQVLHFCFLFLFTIFLFFFSPLLYKYISWLLNSYQEPHLSQHALCKFLGSKFKFIVEKLTQINQNSRDFTKTAPIGLRYYASDSNKKLNKYSSVITQPKSQGASQAMCKYNKRE